MNEKKKNILYAVLGVGVDAKPAKAADKLMAAQGELAS